MLSSDIRQILAILKRDIVCLTGLGNSKSHQCEQKANSGFLQPLAREVGLPQPVFYTLARTVYPPERRCRVKQPQREIDVGLTVGYPHNVRLRYNPHWHRKRKLDKATHNGLAPISEPERGSLP